MPLSAFNKRFAAIMSLDMVEYSIHVSKHPEYTVAKIVEYFNFIRECISRHNGTAYGFAGDSIMGQFVNPTEAVSCAIAIQREITRRNADLAADHKIQFRIGLEVGTVIEAGEGLHGDSVNVAVRLQEAAPAGGILISQTMLDHVDGTIDAAFDAQGTLTLKHIRQTTNVHLVVQEPHARVTLKETFPGALDSIPGMGHRPALAVLPFDISQARPSTAYLADGFAEDLTNHLSHLRWLPIINRGSSFAFRGSQLSPEEIGKRLRVGYLVRGSLEGDTERLRIHVQLIDTTQGNEVSSETFNADRVNVPEVLNDTIVQLASTLQIQLERYEQMRARARRASRLDTWDLVWRGRWHTYRMTHADAALARELFTAALQRDPNEPEVLVHQAVWAMYDSWTMRRSDEKLNTFKAISMRALAADTYDFRGHLLVGVADMYARQHEDALLRFHDALERNPSSATTYHHIGSATLLKGAPDEAVEPMLTSIKLGPHEPQLYAVLADVAAAYYFLGNWNNAIAHADRSIALRPRYWYPRFIKIGALARSGREDEAALELQQLYAQRPNFSRSYVDWLPYRYDDQREYLLEGLELVRNIPPDAE